MSRFDDLLPTFSGEPEFKSNILEFPPSDALRWEVIPSNGTAPFEIDLSDFAVGNPENGIRSRSLLIRQLAPAIRLSSHGRPIFCKYHARDRLLKLWRFLDSLALATSGDITDLAQISNSHGALLKNWLLRSSGLSVQVAGSRLAEIAAILRLAREISGVTNSELLWPTIRFPRGTVHEEVDQLALGQLYRYAKELHRGFRAAEDEGRLLLDVAAQNGGAECKYPSNDESKRKIALIASDFVAACLANPEIHFTQFAARQFCMQKEVVAPQFIPPCDRTPFDAIRWFAPTSEDAMAAVIMVLLHTGWNPETVFGIDISEGSKWYDDRLEEMYSDDKTATVAIYGLKGKTGGEQISFSLKIPWSHPYQVIKYMVERTVPLRESLKCALAELTMISRPSLSERRKIAKLQGMIKSPWLYLAAAGDVKNKPGGRVSVISAKCSYLMFKSICDAAAVHISPKKTAEEAGRIAQGLAKLKPSDARDGFAAFVYDNSLYNILLLKHALGHGSIRATKHYLRQRNQILRRFAQFTTFQNVVFDEVQKHRAIDPTILFIRLAVGEVTPEQRKRLADHRMRTRMNMGCLCPTDPPSEFVKPGSRGFCRVQRCTLCRHGVVFDDSFSAIAIRQAELSYIRSRASSDSFANSSFGVEWAAIRVLIDHVFTEKRDIIEAESAGHLQKLHDGKAYLFDQVPADFQWDI